MFCHGIDLAMVDASGRRQVGIVLQEDVLFNRSVAENIALADPAMSDDGIVSYAATLAGATVTSSFPRATTRSSASEGRSRRSAAAHRDCACAGDRSAHSDLRRGDQRARRRAHYSRQHAPDWSRRTVFRRRPPPFGGAPRQPDLDDRAWPPRQGRHHQRPDPLERAMQTSICCKRGKHMNACQEDHQ